MRAVITGASSGIGEALARHYAGPQNVLGLIARRKQALDSLASDLPGRSAVYALDVTDEQALARAAEDFVARFGPPELVIANAGVSVGTHGEALGDTAKLRRVLEVNVIGLAATLAAFAPAMRAAGRGTLCGIASVSGFRGLAGAGGILRLEGRCGHLAREPAGRAARQRRVAGDLCPGYIDTPMTRVNRYRMPFLLSADEAARRIARAIATKRRLAVIPWQMALVSYPLRALPGWLYDRLAARAPRKPRNVKI